MRLTRTRRRALALALALVLLATRPCARANGGSKSIGSNGDVEDARAASRDDASTDDSDSTDGVEFRVSGTTTPTPTSRWEPRVDSTPPRRGDDSDDDESVNATNERRRYLKDLLAEESVDDRRRARAASASRSSSARRRRDAYAWVTAYVEGDAGHDARGWDDGEAWYALGYARRYGLIEGVGMDERGARTCLERAAALGDADAHEELGFTYASGWDGTPRDAAKSILHYYFAANGGSVTAMMALGYRHKHGNDAPESCESAALYYHEAAKLVVDDAATRTPGVLPFQIEKHRLSAEMSGSNLAAKRERDLVQYYRYSADMGNVDAQVTMGRLYSLGARGLRKDVDAARKYLTDAANAGDATAMAN